MNASTNSEFTAEGLKALPTVTVGGLTLFGVGLSDWVLLATLFYTIAQIGFLFRDRWYRPHKARKVQNGSK